LGARGPAAHERLASRGRPSARFRARCQTVVESGGVHLHLHLSPLQVRFERLRSAGATFSNLHLFPAESVQPHVDGAPPQPYPPGLTLSSCGGKLSREEVAARRGALAKALQLPLSRLRFLRQVHGTSVIQVATPGRDQNGWAEADGGLDPEGDAMVTNAPNVVLCVLMADCAGVLLYDPVQQAVGAAHSGWRGTQANVVRHTLHKMQECYGTDPTKVHAWISPCASGKAYEVGEEVATLFGMEPGVVTPRADGEEKFWLDIPLKLRRQLEMAGLQPQNIWSSPRCTITGTNFHSHRRDGESAGRGAAFIALAG